MDATAVFAGAVVMGFRRTLQSRDVDPMSLIWTALGPLCVELVCTCKAGCTTGSKAHRKSSQTLAFDDAQTAKRSEQRFVLCLSLRRRSCPTAAAVSTIWLRHRQLLL